MKIGKDFITLEANKQTNSQITVIFSILQARNQFLQLSQVFYFIKAKNKSS